MKSWKVSLISVAVLLIVSLFSTIGFAENYPRPSNLPKEFKDEWAKEILLEGMLEGFASESFAGYNKTKNMGAKKIVYTLYKFYDSFDYTRPNGIKCRAYPVKVHGAAYFYNDIRSENDWGLSFASIDATGYVFKNEFGEWSYNIGKTSEFYSTPMRSSEYDDDIARRWKGKLDRNTPAVFREKKEF